MNKPLTLTEEDIQILTNLCKQNYRSNYKDLIVDGGVVYMQIDIQHEFNSECKCCWRAIDLDDYKKSHDTEKISSGDVDDSGDDDGDDSGDDDDSGDSDDASGDSDDGSGNSDDDEDDDDDNEEDDDDDEI